MWIYFVDWCRLSFNAFLLLGLFHLVINTPSRRHKRDDEDFECPLPDGLFADPESCRKFIICAGGHPFTQNCPPSLYFDDIKKFCTRKTRELACGPVTVTTTEPPTPDPLAAQKCDPSQCNLPDCFCSSDGTRIPGDLDPSETPQMIFMTFDGAINGLTYDNYRSALNETRKNPNGCPIRATFFVSHEYSSYFHVQKFYSLGHEIAIHSVSHRGPESWWTKASLENWTEEMVGMREILHKFGNVSRDSLLGVRAPYLKPGGNVMLNMIYDYGFVYDSSLAAPMSSTPIWPYTFDYKIPHRCLSGTCPTQAFPGIWEMPLNTLHSEDGTGGTCVLADQCVFSDDDNIIYDFLMENFLRHYTTNRAPFGLYFHVNWFNERVKIKALNKFIDAILSKYKDAWFVTMQQALLWMRNPTPNSQLANYVPWQCETREPACNLPTTCALPFSAGYVNEIRYMETCTECPLKYPWLGNYDGSFKGQKIVELARDNEASKKKK